MINLVVALNSEARPLVEHYRMERAGRAARFSAFQGAHASLIVSGVGKIAAAEAVAFWHGFTGASKNQGWLNVGVGGHARFPIGEGILAHKVRDRESGRSWYPSIVFDPPCPTAPVLTVQDVEETCDGPWIYEMEAAGFFGAAARLATAELVHCFKVVSDNRTSPASKVTAKSVESLIARNLKNIVNVVSALSELTEQLRSIEREPALCARFLERWRFTFTQRRQLETALRRWETLAGDEEIWSTEIERLSRARDVLRAIHGRLNALPVEFL